MTSAVMRRPRRPETLITIQSVDSEALHGLPVANRWETLLL